MLLEELTNLKVDAVIGLVNRALTRGDKVRVRLIDERGVASDGELRYLRPVRNPAAARSVAEMGWVWPGVTLTAIMDLSAWELENSTLTRDDKGHLLLTVPYGPDKTTED